MCTDHFEGVMLRERHGRTIATLETIPLSHLPDGDVQVRVEFSDLNFKDGLAVTGAGKVTRGFPLIPGIDLAGTVEESVSPRFKPGDRVLLTGWGVGEKWSGGFAQRARVKSEWLLHLPEGMTTREAMTYGTAGLTAGLAAWALKRHGVERAREILVTGSAGGVGSIAIVLLARLGYRVVASTGRPKEEPYLKRLGAESILSRDVLAAPSKPMMSERWGGVIDTVGSQTLASALAGVAERGAVAVCGLAGGADLNTTVLPFILRGITIIGIESVRHPANERKEIWNWMKSVLPGGLPTEMVSEIKLGDVLAAAQAILEGKVRGRMVIDLSG